MPIVGNAKIQSLEQTGNTIEDLCRKLQRNSKNNGVDIVDHLNVLHEGKVVRGGLTRIHAISTNRTFALRFKDVPEVIVSHNTELLCESGEWKCISLGLKPTDKITFIIDGTVQFKTVMEVIELTAPHRQYSLRVPSKGNYVLESGLVVRSD